MSNGPAALDSKRESLLRATSILLASLFSLFAAPMLIGFQPLVEQFAAWGYPKSSLTALGVAGVVAAALLVFPRVAVVGAVLAVVAMLLTIAIQLRHGNAQGIVFPLMLLIGASAVGWARRGEMFGKKTAVETGHVDPPGSPTP